MQRYCHTDLLASIANFSLLIVAISQKKTREIKVDAKRIDAKFD